MLIRVDKHGLAMIRSITFMNDKIGFAVFGGIGGLCLLIGIVLLTFAIRGIQEQQRYLAGHCTITSKQLLEQLPATKER